MTLQIRVIRPFGPLERETPGARFSTEISSKDADALLCEWAPTDELLTFEGPSAWYTAEPRTNPRIGVLAHPDQRRFLGLLRPGQLLHHASEDLRFRVPHVTCDTTERTGYAGPRERKAVAIASNYGGPIHNRGPDILLRNAFITASDVHLFGRRSKWKHYRQAWWSLPRTPASFQDDVSDKEELLARYHTAICLENTCEPWYFSEKFIHAAKAGCVPIYRAHPTVRDGVLHGGMWVDPADHDMDVDRTIAYALSLDREEVAEANFALLETDRVRATTHERVLSTIASALRRQLS
jgi:hypothetical protein